MTSRAFAVNPLNPTRRRLLRGGEAVSAAEADALAAAPGIALRSAARSRPPAPAGSRRRLVRRHRRTRRQCAGRHPQRSISMPSAATLTRRFASHAITGLKRFSTASLQLSARDTRNRYLASRQFGGESLLRYSCFSATRSSHIVGHASDHGAWTRPAGSVVIGGDAESHHKR